MGTALRYRPPNDRHVERLNDLGEDLDPTHQPSYERNRQALSSDPTRGSPATPPRSGSTSSMGHRKVSAAWGRLCNRRDPRETFFSGARGARVDWMW